jgi:predicted DCC family thiol-disulfide oxidoreductase YuxK
MKNFHLQGSDVSEITETKNESPCGWVLYDDDCRSCKASAKSFNKIFLRRGFRFLPLQTPWVQRRLRLKPGVPLEEMHVLTPEGEDLGGADAVIFLAQKIWWTRPLYALARFPGMHALIDRTYRWIAAHRGCNHIACRLPRPKTWPGWIAPIALPIFALIARNRVQPWIFMWLMAGAIFLGCKWLTFWSARNRHVHLRGTRVLGYLFAWPGMDPEDFLPKKRHRRFPRITETIFAIAKLFFGAFLLFVVARFANGWLLAGWIGMIGLIFILHFGLFQLAAIRWRAAGVDVDPIMNAPWCSRSLSEFWGQRWNAAFNQLASHFVFRPLARRLGVVWATLAAFLVSGLIHEMMISLPARGGYGFPTSYFLLQGCGILFERAFPRIRGRIFTIFITAAPAFWLFHPPFVRQVIIPFMHAIRAL